MNHHKKYLLSSLLVFTISLSAQVAKLKPVRWIAVSIPEPSDLCYNSKTNTFFIVSDNGILFETDRECKVIRQVKESNTDFEAVYSDESYVYAVDETHRTISIYDSTTLTKNNVIQVPYSGGRNKGYEALTFNKSKNRFVLLTEKDPVLLFELDIQFKITNQIDLSGVASDISAATYYNDFLWLLSDEDMMILKLDPLTYTVLGKWSLPVINPEGFAFDHEGNILVTCDDMQRVYYFNNPEKNQK